MGIGRLCSLALMSWFIPCSQMPTVRESLMKPSIVKLRVRGDSKDVEFIANHLKATLPVANDSGDRQRNGFVDRYIEIVLQGVNLVDPETGEILNNE